MDGSITERLKQLIKILNFAGLKARAQKNIVDYQKTHAASVALIAKLTMKYRCDVKALAISTRDLRLFVDARREAYYILQKQGVQILPGFEKLSSIIPALLQVCAMRMLLNSRLGEIGLAWHVSQAPDEVLQLCGELQIIVNQSGIPSPAIQKILT